MESKTLANQEQRPRRELGLIRPGDGPPTEPDQPKINLIPTTTVTTSNARLIQRLPWRIARWAPR